MNTPDTKYKKYDDKSTSEEDGPLLFFNYHEFTVDDYNRMKYESETEGKALVVTHFPNNDTTRWSDEYANTRIVRVPRIFNTSDESDIVPQFSSYILGNEPAAFTEKGKAPATKFSPIGVYQGEMFGSSSRTPLVPGLISEDCFLEIIANVNRYLKDAFNPYSFWNFKDNVLDMFSGTLYSKVFCAFIRESHCKRKLDDLERYVSQEVNLKLLKDAPGVKVISPRRTGYLSVCITCFYRSPWDSNIAGLGLFRPSTMAAIS
ncbi:Piso0_005525 [Millerozyma farinosa CBS 7064]|uniref:Ras modification protein ERF4 n=1 Tax=Pichia sorbitophila (strain ATCC MYA-4447 / BCRC 22081 / CBS 7064 / NBRC 10061 / NRRL Y-12695) TaxID=559304 RepID=G8XZ90_PICSO|nr:Piso0_005525 [Millerozyma farinosa CBS 7064]